MSSIAYALLTNGRGAPPAAASLALPVRRGADADTYVNTVAALVPSEVLGLHGLFQSLTTKIVTVNKTQVSQIDRPELLCWTAVFLLGFSIVLYVVPRVVAKKIDRWDLVRSLIPPLAFVAWTMLQRTTAFDAAGMIWHFSLDNVTRTVAAVVLTVILGYTATLLAYKADGS